MNTVPPVPNTSSDSVLAVSAGERLMAQRKEQLFSLDHAVQNPWPWAGGIALIALFALWHVLHFP